MQDIAFSKILTRKEVVLQIGRRVSTKVNTAGRVPVRVHYIYLSTFRFSFINYSFFPLYVLLFHHNYFKRKQNETDADQKAFPSFWHKHAK